MMAEGETDLADIDLRGGLLPVADVAPGRSAGPAPLRRAGSVRRTTSLEVRWPDGRMGQPRFVGEARDVATETEGALPVLLRTQSLDARIEKRMLVALEAAPSLPALETLVGLRIGRDLRDGLERAVAETGRFDTPIRVLIDDLVGLSVIAPFAWTEWDPQPAPPVVAPQDAPAASGVCIGHRPLARQSHARAIGRPATRRAATMVNPADIDGWHPLGHDHVPNVRRARRIDCWLDGDVIHVDSTFQDSARNRARGRTVIHEYRVMATIARSDRRLLTIDAIPCVLPFPECPAATVNLFALIDIPLSELRTEVLTRLRRTAGCTHLNDAVRALADIPIADIEAVGATGGR